MGLLTIALIVAIVWVSVVILAIALCRAAAHSENISERFSATLHH